MIDSEIPPRLNAGAATIWPQVASLYPRRAARRRGRLVGGGE